jgi:alpha-glucosidase
VTHRGERLVEVPAPLGRVPLFARGGAVLPLWESAPASTRGYMPERIELAVCVPLESGARVSVLYEDDGLTTAYRSGANYLTRIACERQQGELRIVGTTTGAGFADCRRTALNLRFRGEIPKDVRLNGTPVALHAGALAFPYVNEGFELVARLG